MERRNNATASSSAPRVILRAARDMQPEPGKTVARREAKRLVFMSFGLFGAAGEYLGETDVAVSGGQVRIQRQCPLEFGNALVRALGLNSGCRP